MSAKKSPARRRPRGVPRGLASSLAADPLATPGRKVAQLCQQASEALSYALAGSADWVLRDLSVASVTPAPDAARLLVTLYAAEGAVAPGDREQLLTKLETARSYLRSEVAGAIHRRRAPDLIFKLASSDRDRADP